MVMTPGNKSVSMVPNVLHAYTCIHLHPACTLGLTSLAQQMILQPFNQPPYCVLTIHAHHLTEGMY